jgi:hypothetical protein
MIRRQILQDGLEQLSIMPPYDPPEPISLAQSLRRSETTRSYNALLRDRGRPCLPLEIGLDVPNVPEKHHEIVSFWQRLLGNYHEPFCFGEQLKRWGPFRDSQQLGRERMPIYIDSLNKRFTKHGFTRIFHLGQDLMRQDKLTTWIEYLNYEYRWHDEFVYLVKCHRAQYDFAWKQLVDSKALRPWETEQFIFRRRKIVSELETERRRAEGKACIAASFVKTRKRHCESSRSELLQNWLTEAQFDLDAAQKERNLTNLRFIAIKTFLKETMYHRYWKKRLDHHDILLRWVLQQIPMIELELNSNPPNTAQETNETDTEVGKFPQS